jgi:hypothetical protein
VDGLRSLTSVRNGENISATLEWTHDRYIGKDPKRIREYEEEVLNAEIARKINLPP